MNEVQKFSAKAGAKFARTYRRAPRYGDMIPVLAPEHNGRLSRVYAVKGEHGWYPVANPARAWRVLREEGRNGRVCRSYMSWIGNKRTAR